MKKYLLIGCLALTGCLSATKKMGLARPDFSKPKPVNAAIVDSAATVRSSTNAKPATRRFY